VRREIAEAVAALRGDLRVATLECRAVPAAALGDAAREQRRARDRREGNGGGVRSRPQGR